MRYRRTASAVAWALVLGIGLPEPLRAQPQPPASAGLALRAGVEALSAGHPEEAAWRFAAVAERHPEIADHAQRLRLRALLQAGRDEEAVAVAHGFLARYPGSPLRVAVLRLLGDAHQRLGDEAGARSTWSQAVRESRDSEERAELHAAIARSQERSGDLRAAAREWLEIWSRSPVSEPAAEADRALTRLARQGVDPRSPRAWARRSEALYDARRNEPALAACERALALGGSPGLQRELRRRRAFLLFRLRRYDEAVQAFGALGPGREARFWRARSLARAGRVDESIRAFEALGHHPRRSLDARALLLASTLLEDRDPSRAAAQQTRVAVQAPSAPLRRAARWRLGWQAYAAGRRAQAARQLAALREEEPDPLDRLRARYWWARSVAGEAGAAELRAIAREFPLTYYGWRAAARVGRDRPATRQPSQPDAPPLDPAGLARVRILVEAGLLKEARAESGRLARRVHGRARWVLARLEQAAGGWHDAQRLILLPNLQELARGPRPGGEELWWLAWPDAFEEVAKTAARHHALDPALLFAVMREESGYRPDILSVVGARGLTQIMPATAQRLARERGDADLDPARLFEPAVNL